MEERHSCQPKQHVHEVQGSTRISGCCDFAHNHRFATVSGEAIPCDESHVHEIAFTTDSCDGHTHKFCGTSSKAIDVGCGRHVHFLKDVTTTDAGHKHEFMVATLIENPTCDER
ncbi:MAG: YmaF family protein [Eubacteriales bacterium]|nr:YmaF family protein [Eubacteriales bacterium]